MALCVMFCFRDIILHGFKKFVHTDIQQCCFTSTWQSRNCSSATWWGHQMETFSALLAFVRGIHRSLVNSLHKGQWRGDLVFPLICAWIDAWVNNREAVDLKRHCGNFDVIGMSQVKKRESYPQFLRFTWCRSISRNFTITDKKTIE